MNLRIIDMQTKFHIYEVEVDARSKPNDEFGGDMELVKTCKTKNMAMRFANKLSLKEKCFNGKKLHEIWIEREVENENQEQWAIKKGKITYHIAL